ncbi:MAG: serine/threonine protein kinase [Alphaproteobacteria bacterium]|nr:serine/threonine protein kinase [Alphaproteobacteria bacterium]
MIQKVFDNNYVILDVLGQGAYSTSYRAFDQISKKVVLIKLYSKSYTKSRIDREYAILSKLKSKSIISLLGRGIVSENMYLVFEYIDGVDLGEYLKNNTLEIGEFCKIAIDLTLAIKQMHNNDIIHRDIKPSNIIIKNDIKPVLIDFGISKIITESDIAIKNRGFKGKIHFATSPFYTQTVDGGIIGTPIFMAPERFEVESDSIESDVYSLGLVFYYMFEKAFPFKTHDLAKLLDEKKNLSTIDIVTSEIDINESINKLVNGMLEPNIKTRYTISSVLTDLYKIQKMVVGKEIVSIYDTESVNVYNTNIINEKKVNSKQLSDEFNSLFTVAEKKEAVVDSREFYRTYLSREYDTLLNQAKISFGLWFSCFIAAGIIIIAILVLLVNGEYEAALGSAIAEIFILFVQRLFKIRENEYRKQIKSKIHHLEVGNYWNLVMQSIDLINDNEVKSNSLQELVEWLKKQS